MRYICGIVDVYGDGHFEPMVVVDTDDFGNCVEFWPYDGDDSGDTTFAADFAEWSATHPGANVTHLVSQRLGGKAAVRTWDQFDQDTLLHPEGPWEG